MARQAVVGNRLPRRRVIRELARRRADPRVAVEAPEPHGADLRIVRRLRPELRPADGAERLREAAAAGAPRADELLALDDPHRSRCDARLRRSGAARTPLAARAVAVAGRDERFADLVADTAAHAAARQQVLVVGRADRAVVTNAISVARQHSCVRL